jgi:hypothetical protein
VVEGVRYYCWACYQVYVGTEDLQAIFAEKEAAQMGAVFMHGRKTPWFECACGQVLDFAPEYALTIQ